VVIDTFNHAAYIARAVESALEQMPAPLEVLVVDDGSSDRTDVILKQYGSSIRYLRKANGGQGSAFNLGIRESRGDIVAFLDGDDYWLPGKLAAISEAFVVNEAICAVGHGITIGEPDGRAVPLLPEREFEIDLTQPGSLSTFLAARCFLGTSRFAARRQVLLEMLPVPEQLMIGADDWCNALAAAKGRVKVLRGPYTFYRLHHGNLFQTRSRARDVLNRRAAFQLTLSQLLPPKLMALGLPRSLATDLVETFWVDGTQAYLSLYGGSRSELLGVERRRTRLYPPVQRTWRHSVFRMITMAIALLLGARPYYRLRHWYIDSGLNMRIARVRSQARPLETENR